MQMLLDSFARPRRTALGAAWAKQLSFFLDEYKYDYGALHPPYQQADNQRRLTEVLHPVFIKRQSGPLNIAHVTDTHGETSSGSRMVQVMKENTPTASTPTQF
jgi:hypothetical protein